MSETAPKNSTAKSRFENFETAKRAHEESAYAEAAYNGAGETRFDDEAKQLLEDQAVYEAYMENFVNDDRDPLDRHIDFVDSGEVQSSDDARIRRMDMIAKNIAELKANGADQAIIDDKESKLAELVDEYARGKEFSSKNVNTRAENDVDTAIESEAEEKQSSEVSNSNSESDPKLSEAEQSSEAPSDDVESKADDVSAADSDKVAAFKALSRDEKAAELTKAMPWAAEMIKDMDDHALNGYAGTFETPESVKPKDDTESSESVETPADTNAPSEIPSESEESDTPSSDEEKTDDKVEVAAATTSKFGFLDDARKKYDSLKRKESDSEKSEDDQLDESDSEPSVAPVAYAEFENTDAPKPSRFGRLTDKLKGIFKRKNNALESGDKTAAEQAESEAKTIRKRVIGVIAIGAAIMGGAAAIKYGMDHQWALPFLDGDNNNQLESIPDDTYEVPGLQPDGTIREPVPTPSSLMNYLTEHNVLNGEGGESLLDRNDIDSSSWYGFQDDLMNRYPDEFYRMEDGNVGLQNPGNLSTGAQQYIARYK